MDYTKNIKTYYWYSVFAELIIIGPIMVLYMFAKGLSFTEIMLLNSISSISVVAFDVPTGAVADKIGRKFSLLLGSILWGAGLSLYIVGNHFFIFALGEIIFSLGTSFKSGANNALIYDSLKEIGREKEYPDIEGHASSLVFYAQAVGSIVAGFVYEINIYLPIIISIGFLIISALIALKFKETPVCIQYEKETGYLTQITDSLKFVWGHEKVKAVIFYSMIFYIFYRTGFWFFQPYMQSVYIPVKYFGIIFFIFNIAAALASKYNSKIMNWTKPKTLSFISLLIIFSFVILGTVKIWAGVFAMVLQQVARGLYKPVTTKQLNKHIPSEKRATILSFQSLAGNIAVALAYPIMGLLKDSTDVFTSHLVMAFAMIVLTYITIRYMDKRLGVDYKRNEITESV